MGWGGNRRHTGSLRDAVLSLTSPRTIQMRRCKPAEVPTLRGDMRHERQLDTPRRCQTPWSSSIQPWRVGRIISLSDDLAEIYFDPPGETGNFLTFSLRWHFHCD